MTSLLGLFALGTLAAGGALADDYPGRPVRIVVPYPPAGATDVLARAITQSLQESLKQPVVIDYKAGASGMIGSGMVARSAPDGYTLLINASIHVIIPSLYSKVDFDALEDFTPVTQLSSAPLILVVNNDLPIKSVRELIDYARANPGRVNYASSGNGASNHLAGELFTKLSQTNMNHVPYKGSAAAMTDLIGGHVQIAFDSLPSALPHIKSGRVRALAVSGSQRSVVLPELPTVAESGLPGFEVSTWYGLWAPKGTPHAVVDRIAKDTAKALATPEVRERYLAIGNVPVGNSPAEFAAHCRSEAAKWGRVVKDAGIRAD